MTEKEHHVQESADKVVLKTEIKRGKAPEIRTKSKSRSKATIQNKQPRNSMTRWLQSVRKTR